MSIEDTPVRSSMNWAVAFIIVVEFCERIGYYTFQGTQKGWLQDRGFTNATSSSLNQIFALLSYISCFFGGWLAETSVGRFKTIAVLCVVYVIGCFLAAVAAHSNIQNVDMYFVGTFVLIALGTGGIKPNVCTFGADQIDPAGPNVDRKKSAFFLYFYLTINVGCVVAFGVLANTATNGLPPLVAQQNGYFFTYIIAACCMTLALAFFVLGVPLYREDSFEVNSHPVFKLFLSTLWKGRRNTMGKVALLGWTLIPVLIVVAVISAFVRSWYMTVISLTVDVLCVVCLCIAHRDNRWAEQAQVAQCLDCIPSLLVGNLAFNILYNSMASLFFSQSCQMDTRLGSSRDSIQLNGAFFNLADCAAIVLFTPLVDKLMIPTWERLLGHKVSLNMKIYAGIFIGISSQIVAAGIEYARLSSPVLDIPSYCAAMEGPEGDQHHVHMSAISAWWMSIPYALIGLGEILVNPVLQHTAYDGAHPSMRSMLQAFNLFALGGMPNAISSAFSQAVAPLIPNNMNYGNLPVVYFINAGMGLLGCCMYWLVARPVSPSATRCSAESDRQDTKAGMDKEKPDMDAIGASVAKEAEQPDLFVGIVGI
eukprot:TRINITY_DN20420_c0_g1_i1.p1 TRINITY_DN20420_c0_g1~~TRINITY_DN20420_c0_g1_i1.p1  ORF type:complete len:610 (-),score=103.06 TRINITY_DN20420_c0_g1_i1:259-2037(-)